MRKLQILHGLRELCRAGILLDGALRPVGAPGAPPVHAVPGAARRCGLEVATGCARHP